MDTDVRASETNIRISEQISFQLQQIWQHEVWEYIDASKGVWKPMTSENGAQQCQARIFLPVFMFPLEAVDDQYDGADDNSLLCRV